MDEQRQDDQIEPIFNSSVAIQDVAMKIFQEQWMIETGGERGSGRSVLVVRHDDVDDLYVSSLSIPMGTVLWFAGMAKYTIWQTLFFC